MDNFFQEFAFVLIALVFVASLALILLKSLKGFYNLQKRSSPMKLLLTLPLGSRERLVVVTYRNSEYLVGITQGGMSLLDKLPISDPENESNTSTSD
jgi:flagellar biogenesis protein FliO